MALKCGMHLKRTKLMMTIANLMSTGFSKLGPRVSVSL